MLGDSISELTAKAKEGLVLIGKDRKIIFADNQAVNLLGVSNSEIIGKCCCQLTSLFPCANSGCSDPKIGCRISSCKNDVHFTGEKIEFITHVVKDQAAQYMGLLHIVSAADNSDLIKIKDDASSVNTIEGFIGTHPVISRLIRRVVLLAKTDVTAHIYAESGCGKEIIAGALHKMSSRHDAPFIKINCSAIPATLLESALFGHTKGAFTGASHDSKGFVEAAQHGTLFLDEIGDIPLSVQVKLLRLIQNREYSRIGESTLKKADIRIITATNQKLTDLLKEHKIREDFYYRINVFPLNIPPLRERLSDIPALTEHFIELFNKRFKRKIEGLTSQAMKLFMTYSWPGNVRELENALEHAFVLVDEGLIDIEDLPEDLAANLINQPGNLSLSEDRSQNQSVKVQSFSSVEDSINNDQSRMVLSEKEKIVSALKRSHGNRSEAASLLGYSRVTLWKKMKQYELQDSTFKVPDNLSTVS